MASVSEFVLQRIQILKKKKSFSFFLFFFFWGGGGVETGGCESELFLQRIQMYNFCFFFLGGGGGGGEGGQRGLEYLYCFYKESK